MRIIARLIIFILVFPVLLLIQSIVLHDEIYWCLTVLNVALIIINYRKDQLYFLLTSRFRICINTKEYEILGLDQLVMGILLSIAMFSMYMENMINNIAVICSVLTLVIYYITCISIISLPSSTSE